MLGRPGRRRRQGHRGLRGARLHPRARGHRDVLLDVLRRLPRAGQGPRLRRPGRGRGAASARAALRIALDVLLRLLAPILPYATEEVWSWWHDGSGAPRRLADRRRGQRRCRAADPAILTAVGAALAGVRKAKSEAKVGMRAEVPSMTLAGPGRCAGADPLRRGRPQRRRQDHRHHLRRRGVRRGPRRRPGPGAQELTRRPRQALPTDPLRGRRLLTAAAPSLSATRPGLDPPVDEGFWRRGVVGGRG